MGWLPGWTHRMPVTFDRTAIATATRPVLALRCAEGTLGWNGVVAADLSNARITGDDGTTLWDWYPEVINLSATSILQARPASTLPGATSGVAAYVYWRSDAASTNASEGNTFQDCVARWALQEASGTVYDSTANNNDGTVIGAAYGATGQIGDCLDFEDTVPADYVNCGSGASLNITSDFSLSAWLKAESLSVNRYGFGRYGSSKGYAFGYMNTNAIRFRINDVGNITTETVTDQDWHHLACTHTNGTQLAYLDGVLCSWGTGGDTAADPGSVSTPATIASRDTGPYQAFDGLIDEMRIASSRWPADQVLADFGAQATGASAKITFGTVETMGGHNRPRYGRILSAPDLGYRQGA